MADPTPLRPAALTPAWRALIGLLIGIAAVNLPLTLAAAILMTDPPVTPPVLVRSLLVFSVLPAATAAALRRVFRATLRFQDDALRLDGTALRVEVPGSSLRGVRIWRFPVPCSGLSLVLDSGVTLGAGLATRNLDALLDLLATHGVATPADRSHPTAVYAREQGRHRRITWWRLLLKFVGFGALPAGVLFYTHQHIAYGGTFGQYYLYGPAAFFETLLIYWMVTAIYLALYASVWRGLAEAVSLAAAWLTPARAGTVRQAAERSCSLLYYGGVPLLLLYRYSG